MRTLSDSDSKILYLHAIAYHEYEGSPINRLLRASVWHDYKSHSYFYSSFSYKYSQSLAFVQHALSRRKIQYISIPQCAYLPSVYFNKILIFASVTVLVQYFMMCIRYISKQAYYFVCCDKTECKRKCEYPTHLCQCCKCYFTSHTFNTRWITVSWSYMYRQLVES